MRKLEADETVKFWYRGKQREGRVLSVALLPFPVYDVVVRDTVILHVPAEDILLEEAVEGNDGTLQSSLAR